MEVFLAHHNTWTGETFECFPMRKSTLKRKKSYLISSSTSMISAPRHRTRLLMPIWLDFSLLKGLRSAKTKKEILYTTKCLWKEWTQLTFQHKHNSLSRRTQLTIYQMVWRYSTRCLNATLNSSNLFLSWMVSSEQTVMIGTRSGHTQLVSPTFTKD